jgi:exodeoxyribonuclease VII large subunit
MKAIFGKENDKMTIKTDDKSVSNVLDDLISVLFVDHEIKNGTYIVEASFSNLEMFNSALKEKGVDVELTDRMNLALEKRAEKRKIEEKKEEVIKPEIIKIEKRERESTRKSRSSTSTDTGIVSLTLSKLFSKVKQAVEVNMPNEIWLEAEIASLTKSPKGHYYLSLIETDYNGNELAKNQAIIWSSNASTVDRKFKEGTGQVLASGQKVLLQVQVTFEAKFGLNLKVININPSFTLGDMDAKMMKITNKLKDEGIYENNKKVCLPYIFKKIAVISPEEAAGLKDFQVDAEKLAINGLCDFDYYQAYFQGKDTVNSVLKAFDNVDKSKIEYDAIIVIRGGGAKTDLHYLNEYDIAKRICNHKLPVIVGIGHQIDHGVLDEVACMQHDTPSKVIGYIYAAIQEKYNLLAEVRLRVLKNMDNFIQTVKRNVEGQNANNKFKIQNSLTVYKNEIDKKSSNIKTNIQKMIVSVKNEVTVIRNNLPERMIGLVEVSKRNVTELQINNGRNLSGIISHLKSDVERKHFYVTQFNPKELFKKGFSIALNEKEKPIVSIDDVKDGDIVKLYLNDGFINTKVEKK